MRLIQLFKTINIPVQVCPGHTRKHWYFQQVKNMLRFINIRKKRLILPHFAAAKKKLYYFLYMVYFLHIYEDQIITPTSPKDHFSAKHAAIDRGAPFTHYRA